MFRVWTGDGSMENMKNTYLRGFLRVLAAALMISVMAFGLSAARAAGAEIWVGADTAVTYATIKEAMAAHPAPAEIHIKGEMSEAAVQAKLTEGYTLVISGDVTAKGNGGNGLELAKGSKMICENGAKLKMSGFARALDQRAEAVIGDGVYEFSGNSQRTMLGGVVKGTANKTDVKITAEESADSGFFVSTSRFENATITVNSKKRTWQDAHDLMLINTDLTMSGFGMGNYVNNLVMKKSTLTLNQGSSWR